MVSIIIPAYNSEKYIKECLDSIIEQDFNDYEIIVVNDNSSDNTLKILNEYSNKYEKVKVFSNDFNMGAGMSRNVGLDNVIGDYIMFVDSDDYLLPNSLQFIENEIKKNNFDILQYSLTSTQKAKNNKGVKKLKGKDAFCMFLCYRRISGYVGGKVIKKSIIGNDRFDNLRIGEDGDFMIRMFSKANNVLYTKNEIYFYRIHDDSSSERKVFTDRMLEGVKRLPIIKKKIFSKKELVKYMDLFCVFEFRTLFARIDKMIKTNSVNQFENDFYSIIDRMKEIQGIVFKKTLRWNIKNYIFIIKFWLICLKYNK